jgi:hypothetical protein
MIERSDSTLRHSIFQSFFFDLTGRIFGRGRAELRPTLGLRFTTARATPPSIRVLAAISLTDVCSER